MTVERDERGSVVILRFSGEIDLNNSRVIRDLLAEIIDAKKYFVVAECSAVDFIDSSGIGSLIAGHSRLRNFDGGLKLCGLNASIKKIFDITNVTNFFEIFDEEAEAAASFPA